MAIRKRKWLKGCGIGCGAAILLFFLLSIGGSVFMMRPFRGAVAVREKLDEKHGGQADYTPAADGAISARRLEAFLTVREKLMAVCEYFGELDRKMDRLDNLESDAPKKEVFSEFFQVSKSIFGMGSRMGEFFRVRNDALMEADMGRGEYTYIYVMAYLDRLRPPEEPGEERRIALGQPNERVRLALRQMLQNQQAAAGPQESAVGEDDPAGTAQELATQISWLENHPDALPWQNGLPETIASSLAPYRERLEPLYCADTVDLEFTENRTWFIGIQGN